MDVESKTFIFGHPFFIEFLLLLLVWFLVLLIYKGWKLLYNRNHSLFIFTDIIMNFYLNTIFVDDYFLEWFYSE